MLTIPEMVAKGQRKLQEKGPQLAQRYNESKQRAIAAYNELPFNNTMKQNYAAGIQGATYHAPDPGKWARNFSAKVS